ncbi:DUF924 family protein [Ferrimonas lipolytica]|uniref:DUF924 domain-containing protein n=1 Tax=Ferrimonas lipolytica TaxID=2724191 RepID=A0A6H1UDA0_9GAMM|nr:DUF924 family protein [Ferrimonas lipolytica]QIZ77051.1 DUF924 domain-containing protein [Ferrimonas lipolytica]
MQQIIDFWFSECSPKHWFQKDAAFDELIRSRFGQLHQQALQCELFLWRQTPLGRLAEIIVLDQFSRNIHRDTPLAFAADPLALALAQQAIAAKDEQSLTLIQRSFLYLPYMHSESQLIHQQAERFYRKNGLEDNLRFELHHKQIIDRFGRYPHRNVILGRQSTDDEILFLQQPGSSF